MSLYPGNVIAPVSIRMGNEVKKKYKTGIKKRNFSGSIFFDPRSGISNFKSVAMNDMIKRIVKLHLCGTSHNVIYSMSSLEIRKEEIRGTSWNANNQLKDIKLNNKNR